MSDAWSVGDEEKAWRRSYRKPGRYFGVCGLQSQPMVVIAQVESWRDQCDRESVDETMTSGGWKPVGSWECSVEK